MMTVRRRHNTFGLHTRSLKHPGRTEDTQSHRQRARRAELEPTPADSGPARPGRCFDPRGLLYQPSATGPGRRDGEAWPGPPPAGGREESIRSGLVLMPEECLEKSCLSPLCLTHHLPVSRSVREELP